ncbi:hypothetical protein M885DRAFT_576130 [Pelagophyceae sp. CCMP2097]|nr:hypothetical protein M885DRAFT_576130 [Pelagophyceae sp. CCMP2097]
MAEMGVHIPPPLPLYTFPRSKTPEQPPRTGFAHTLPVVHHRIAPRAEDARPLPLREPLQDPRRGLLLAQWFGARDREESEILAAQRSERERRAMYEPVDKAVDKEAEEEDLAPAKAEKAPLLGSPVQKESFQRGRGGFEESKKREACTRRLIYDTADRGGVSTEREDDDVTFDSWFESGNLRAAWRVEGRRQGSALHEPSRVDQEYDLLCNKDTHTNGHVQWFYFSVLRPPAVSKKPLRIRLNMVNMMKKSSLYGLGMLPVAFSQAAQDWIGLLGGPF